MLPVEEARSGLVFDADQLRKDSLRIRQSGYFDQDWYLSKHPDVEALKIDPAEHYLLYGSTMGRDPGPEFSTGFFLDTHPGGWQKSTNPLLRFLGKNRGAMTPSNKTVLWAAQNVALRGDRERAVALAEAHLPPELAHTVHILRANAALLKGGEADWVHHVNAYLEHYGVEPLCLTGEGALFDRLSTRPLPPVTGGPLISVLMSAWNAEKTVRMAARSILNQTWRNLELLIVDDCSEDGTWAVLQEIAATDDRVRILRNKVNVGPYVSKNIALMQSRGEWITGHDADDWAYPQRLERHAATAVQEGLQASLTYMIRIQPSGAFSHIGRVTSFSMDGVARKASISCLFKRSLLSEKLGYWDSVRFGADSEMIARTQRLLGDACADLRQIGMICLDLEPSLTNHPEHGVSKVSGISPVRAAYRDGWTQWQDVAMTPQNAYLEFPQATRRYPAAAEMTVSPEDISANLQPMQERGKLKYA